MQASRVLLAATIVGSLLLSGCTVRVDPGTESSDTRVNQTSQQHSNWSITTNGCTITNETPQQENPQPITIQEREEVTGPLSKSWTWKIQNTSFERFHVRLTLEGPQGTAYYHANQLSLSLEGGCGQRPVKTGSGGNGNLQISTSTQQSGNVVDWDGEGLTMLGAWTLNLEAEEAVLVYDVEVIVEY